MAEKAWQHPSVLELFAETYVPKQIRESYDGEKRGFQNMRSSIQLVTDGLLQLSTEFSKSESGRGCSAVAQTLDTFRNSRQLFDSFPACSDDGNAFHEFLGRLVMSINAMSCGSSLLIPGGWSTGGARPDGWTPHVALLFVLHRRFNDTFSLAVCNNGDGSEYHITRVCERSAQLLKNLSYVLYHIPRARVADSAIWFMILRPLVYRGRNGPSVLYEALLPYLNQQPLLSNHDHNYTSSSLPVNSDFSRIGVVMEALRHTLIYSGLTPAYAMHTSVLTELMFGKFLLAQLKGAGALPTSDAMTVRFIAQGKGL